MPPMKKKVVASVIDLTVKKAKELVGWKELEVGAKTGYKYRKADGSAGRFILTKNTDNRKFSPSLAEQYLTMMLKQTWAGQANSASKTGNGESIIVDSKGMAVSLAHRCVGLILAEERRQYLANCTDTDMDERGFAKEEIVLPDVVLVTGVDPQGADTADTGKERSLADVLFRRNLFDSDKYTESQLHRISTVLSVAARHVWLRSNGYRVKGAPKLYHPEAVEFVQNHPLLLECCLFVFEANNTQDPDNKRPLDKFGFSLGYAAAHSYLANFRNVDYGKYVEGEINFTRKPSRELWDGTENFWTKFADVENAGKKNSPWPAIVSLYNVLEDSANEKKRLDRDQQCTVVTRAMQAFLEDEEGSCTTNALRMNLINTKNKEKFIPEFERFGGLDIDREVLKNEGWIEETSLSRTSVDSWKVGDRAWVAEEGYETYFGTITSISNDGTVVEFDVEEGEGNEVEIATYKLGIALLRTEKPEEPPAEFVPVLV